MNKQNEILKHKYLLYLKHVHGRAAQTVSKHEQSIHYYELCFNDEDFWKYKWKKGIKFKEYLIEQGLSGNSIKTILNQNKQFLSWLSRQSGYKSKIKFEDVEYLNETKRDERLANVKVLREYPNLDYILKLVNSIDSQTEIGRRNRALIAFASCTGIRDKAIMTLQLGCININELSVIQDPRRGVETKSSKYIPSIIFQFHSDLIEIIREWILELRSKRFLDSDPFIPIGKANHSTKDYCFITAEKVKNRFYNSTVSIRKIFKEEASKANLKYFIPHSFRDFAILNSVKSTTNGLELKAVSQNFGHNNVLTTFSNYGEIPPNELLEILHSMSFQNNQKSRDQKIDEIYNWMQEQQKSE